MSSISGNSKELPTETKSRKEIPAELAGDELQGYIENETKKNEYERKEKILTTLNWWARITLGMVFGALMLSAIVVIVHYLAPPTWRWLPPTDLVAIRSYTFSGVIIGIVAGYLKRYL